MKPGLTLVWVAFLLAPASSIAAGKLTTYDCGAKNTQSEMNECFGALWQRSDERLNVLYGQLFKKLKGLRSEAFLRDSERAWIEYRDRECAFESAGVEGGSVQPTVHAACMYEVTQERITSLASQLNCSDGVVSCPDSAPAIWEGEWVNGTTVLITVSKNKVKGFYWHGDYQSVGQSSLSPDDAVLTFEWQAGTVTLERLSETKAKAIIREAGHAEMSVVLEH